MNKPASDPARNPPRPVARRDPPWCDEAQADGVPCYERGRDCETCERARPGHAEGEDPRDRPAPPPEDDELPLSGA